jgi:hypothetical protein
VVFKKKVFSLLTFLKTKKTSNLFEKIEKKLPDKHPFLVLILLWIVVYLFIYSRIVEDLNRARYFLAITPVVFIFIAFWFNFLLKIVSKKLAWIIILILALVLLFSNLWATFEWYNALSTFQYEPVNRKELKLGYHKDIITLNSMEKSINYMVIESKKQGNNICFSSADYQYNRGIEYLSSINYPETPFFRFNDDDLYRNCSFFVIARLKHQEGEIPEEYLSNFKITNKHKCGALNVWTLEYKEELEGRIKQEGQDIKKKNKEDEKEKLEEEENKETVDLWKEVF